jgi:hypothetical protein
MPQVLLRLRDRERLHMVFMAALQRLVKAPPCKLARFMQFVDANIA